MRRRIPCVYRITCHVTKRSYIGQAEFPNERWAMHRHQLAKGRHHCKELQEEWTFYGSTNFTFAIVEECGFDTLRDRERFHIMQQRLAGTSYKQALPKPLVPLILPIARDPDSWADLE